MDIPPLGAGRPGVLAPLSTMVATDVERPASTAQSIRRTVHRPAPGECCNLLSTGRMTYRAPGVGGRAVHQVFDDPDRRGRGAGTGGEVLRRGVEAGLPFPPCRRVEARFSVNIRVSRGTRCGCWNGGIAPPDLSSAPAALSDVTSNGSSCPDGARDSFPAQGLAPPPNTFWFS